MLLEWPENGHVSQRLENNNSDFYFVSAQVKS